MVGGSLGAKALNEVVRSGKARSLGTYEVFFGDYRKLFTAAASYSQVSKEDLQRVARKYFMDKNRTVATLIPEKEEPAK